MPMHSPTQCTVQMRDEEKREGMVETSVRGYFVTEE